MTSIVTWNETIIVHVLQIIKERPKHPKIFWIPVIVELIGTDWSYKWLINNTATEYKSKVALHVMPPPRLLRFSKTLGLKFHISEKGCFNDAKLFHKWRIDVTSKFTKVSSELPNSQQLSACCASLNNLTLHLLNVMANRTDQ